MHELKRRSAHKLHATPACKDYTPALNFSSIRRWTHGTFTIHDPTTHSIQISARCTRLDFRANPPSRGSVFRPPVAYATVSRRVHPLPSKPSAPAADQLDLTTTSEPTTPDATPARHNNRRASFRPCKSSSSAALHRPRPYTTWRASANPSPTYYRARSHLLRPPPRNCEPNLRWRRTTCATPADHLRQHRLLRIQRLRARPLHRPRRNPSRPSATSAPTTSSWPTSAPCSAPRLSRRHSCK